MTWPNVFFFFLQIMTSEEGEEEEDDDADEDMYWRFAAKGKPRRRTNRLVAPASWLSCASSWKKEPRQHFAILSLQMILVLFQDENTATMNFRGDVTRCYVPCHNNTCWCKSRLHCIHISGWDILIHCAIKKKNSRWACIFSIDEAMDWTPMLTSRHVRDEFSCPAPSATEIDPASTTPLTRMKRILKWMNDWINSLLSQKKLKYI